MVVLGFGLERVVLRPLIGRPIISVIMATIGLPPCSEASPPWRLAPARGRSRMPISDSPISLGPVTVPPVQVVGAGVSLVFLAGFTWFFLKSRVGVAMRAVADSQQVAMAMGINVQRYFALAWAMAGVVSALGGIVWGAMLGVDNQLALVGLKVFPGGDPGRPRLDHRRGRRRANRRRRRELGGRLSRPLCRRRHQGFRALCPDDRRADGPPRRHLRPAPDRAVSDGTAMFHREAGVFKTSYAADMALYPLPIAQWSVAALAALFIVDRATDLQRILRFGPQSDPDRDRRRARPQHPGWVYRADLDRPRRLYVGWRLYRGQFDHASRHAVLGRDPGGRADGGADRLDRRHPVPAHQGDLSGDRHSGGAADHRVDDQPCPVDLGGRAGLDRDPAPVLFRHRPQARGANLLVSDVFRGAGDGRPP